VDLEAARRLRAKTRRKDVIFISALTGEGLPHLMTVVTGLLASAPAPGVPAKRAVTKLPEMRSSELAVERRPFGFAVRGERVERLVERTDLESEGGLARFQRELDRLGVNRALEAAGVKAGDTVRIAGVEFEYQP
ncbi:MAG TPA: Obg family GTPase CgtA, partial [Candidatus Dormibacteraeota bacterium]|nr:Obg family GTPase CgtA [Candidatus Dormibacteraeota bacterium]